MKFERVAMKGRDERILVNPDYLVGTRFVSVSRSSAPENYLGETNLVG